MPVRKYTYYDFTLSLCPECLRRVDAKIVFENGNVYMLKRCNEHGNSKVLIADDIEYYKNIRNYNKPSETPYKFNTKTHYGCPYDCGLCPDHEQHSCLTVVEVTDRCNLTCPTCYAGSSPTYGRHRTLEEVKTMLDTIVRNEKEPDVVQISGGEPTIHNKSLIDWIKYIKSLGYKVKLDTNGTNSKLIKQIIKEKGKSETVGLNFQKFLDAYPKKMDRIENDTAANLWRYGKLDMKFCSIMKSLAERVEHSYWAEKIREGDTSRIQNPSTFLRNKLYEQEFTRVQPKISEDEKDRLKILKIKEEYENGEL
mgnify:CR=1 FL=1